MTLIVGTNSYVSRSDADAYFVDNLQNTAWTALTDAIKDQALITASGQISRMVKEDCRLPLTPPIAQPLADAASELGLYLATNTASITIGDTGSNTKRVKAGSAEVEFFRPQSGGRFPFVVLDILRVGNCLDSLTHPPVGTPFAGGTDVESVFDDPTKYDRLKGFY